MSGLRRAVYLAMSFAALVAALVIAATARAPSDPFGTLHGPTPGSGPAPSTRTGVTGADPKVRGL